MSGSVNFQSSIRAIAVAKAFFQAVTKPSDNVDDILPQEDGDSRLSVYSLFSELFPEFVKDRTSPVTNIQSGSHGLTRLQFNKLGYEIYVKEQSRRVPSPHAKPGNPGYGFRQAKWRNTTDDINDRILMFEIFTSVSIPSERCERIRQRVEEYRKAWDLERRPCRCAGPGRPRGQKETTAGCMEKTIVNQLGRDQEIYGHGGSELSNSLHEALPSSSIMVRQGHDHLRIAPISLSIDRSIYRPPPSLHMIGFGSEQAACVENSPANRAMPSAHEIRGFACDVGFEPIGAGPSTFSCQPSALSTMEIRSSMRDTHFNSSDDCESSPFRPQHCSGVPARPAYDGSDRASKRLRDGAEPPADEGLNKASLAHLLC
jgi:hypothetical protein